MSCTLLPSSVPAASFGDETGYRFEADAVELHADIRCHLPDCDSQDWVLQLWADEAIKVAELPLGQLRPDGRGAARVAGRAIALPPAGQAARRLSMALVSGAPGAYDCLHARKTFAQPHHFVQPRLEGAVHGHREAGDWILDIEGIANPRDAVNLSGTLALELWSLDAPYAGGDWSGTPIASLALGCLGGQQAWTRQRHVLRAAGLPAGGRTVLMLREWTPAGYVTRDWRQLEPPQREAASTVSINRSTTAVIRSLQGISAKVARTIVASRPFASVDELLRVRGMTPRLFARVRDQLQL